MTIYSWIGYALVAGTVGLLVAMTELLSRYRDEPEKAIASRAGLFYLSLNFAFSVAAFALVVVFGPQRFLPARAPASSGDQTVDLKAKETKTADAKPAENKADSVVSDPGTDIPGALGMALVAGFLGVVILRATVRVGPSAVGPGQIIDTLLLYVDRQIDRNRAKARLTMTIAKMKDVDFEQAKLYLPIMLSASMQRISNVEQEALGRRLREIDIQPMSSELKAYSLGFVIMELAGEDLLNSLVSSGAASIRKPAAPFDAPPGPHSPAVP